jgi:flavin reductase (DIM6/NTAB) family NADH-FMN oxidoreductase RutF
MAYKFRTVSPASRPDNVFKLIDRDWMLVTAGTMDKFNMLTASWGGFGILWEREVAMCYIRPGRHTFGFMERHGMFTLSFFEEKYRPALKLCGKKSGRDTDKALAAGLTPVEGRKGGVYFAEARLVFECRKLYSQDIDPARFVDPKLDIFYPKKDYHRMYVGEIFTCLAR